MTIAVSLTNEVGLVSIEDIGTLLEKASTLEACNDLDKNVMLQLASQLKGFEKLLDRAVKYLNAAAVAEEDTTRITITTPMVALSMTHVEAQEKEGDEDVHSD